MHQQFKPDLVITDMQIDKSNSKIYYTVKNFGKGVAQAGHNTSLFVDDIKAADNIVPVQLALDESYTGCFEDYTWTYTPPSDNITVCADLNDVINESIETNNCLIEILICGDVDRNGVVNILDARLLMHYLIDPDKYPVNSWVRDVEGDNDVDSSDVHLLLKHVFDPLEYPLCCI